MPREFTCNGTNGTTIDVQCSAYFKDAQMFVTDNSTDDVAMSELTFDDLIALRNWINKLESENTD